MSVHWFAIPNAKVSIFCETAKCYFTSINGGLAFTKNMKSSLAADNLFGDDNLHDELVNDVGGVRMF
jgi:hypothetical protein